MPTVLAVSRRLITSGLHAWQYDLCKVDSSTKAQLTCAVQAWYCNAAWCHPYTVVFHIHLCFQASMVTELHTLYVFSLVGITGWCLACTPCQHCIFAANWSRVDLDMFTLTSQASYWWRYQVLSCRHAYKWWIVGNKWKFGGAEPEHPEPCCTLYQWSTGSAYRVIDHQASQIWAADKEQWSQQCGD